MELRVNLSKISIRSRFIYLAIYLAIYLSIYLILIFQDMTVNFL